MTGSSLPSPESEKRSSLPSRGAVPHLPDGVTVGGRRFDREFQSETAPLTPESLEKARAVLAKSQRMHWRNDYPYEGHRSPCFSVKDVEWLFGYIDATVKRAEHAERKWHGWHIQSGTFGVTCPLCKHSESVVG